MSEFLLEVEHVSKGFPGVRALEDMHLNLRHGEVLAVVGENGAGKSTLMKLLSGIYTPDSGRFVLDGQDYAPTSPKHAMDLGIGIIHQELNLMPHLTVAQNILIGREPRQGRVLISERQLNREAREIVERLDLPLDVTALVSNLTVAKQQMVEIAKALSHETRVLIMDEPTAALNDAEVATLHDLIRRYRDAGTSIIYISHRMDELKAISDRITVIRDGHYVDTVDTADAELDQVISLMVGRAVDTSATPVGIQPDRPVVLEVDGLSTRDLLRDVSFDLREGEILGFAGLMGAGRTEVARAVVGADRMSGGRICLRGKDVRISNPAEAANLRIGYLSEDRKQLGLLLNQTVTSNIVLTSLQDQFSRWGLVRAKAAQSTAQDMVTRLGVKTPSVRQTTKNLSGGNQQKVVIAKWLVKDCDVLIFDEPTRGIDVGAKSEIYNLLNDLAAQGKSIIMISSDLPEVLRMSHRVVVMTEGRVSGILSHDEATPEAVMHLATLRPAEHVEDAVELGLVAPPASDESTDPSTDQDRTDR
ncbi:sugar ABC transporter ATP-binding protein [Luteipulveratus mongoliensis]|uniref:D-ribose transporter ATP-binding protein n=1 Tax=Luteipulveratus mongoliensis TaxID=571913 RepID=A0A0K1JG00_9MICO|nr:sugar ABC transporter ATP-binding protein [Luteipulveratus mongoliensis]AKU15647.1 D-ribose transporter ATP-binding protein [Luteipulveratus mongoliensis]